MSEVRVDNLRQWYESERARYEGLTNILRNTVESLIRNAGIDFLSVTSRTKTLDCFSEKIERKSYSKRTDVTDLSGIRVITFIESDAREVYDLIKSSFSEHTADSLDKADELGVDRFGYRSLHFTGDLVVKD